MLGARVVGWMQALPNDFASRTPFHGTTAAGGFQRNMPTGGAAYGMPLNTRSPASAEPSTGPPWVATTGPLVAGDVIETPPAVLDSESARPAAAALVTKMRRVFMRARLR